MNKHFEIVSFIVSVGNVYFRLPKLDRKEASNDCRGKSSQICGVSQVPAKGDALSKRAGRVRYGGSSALKFGGSVLKSMCDGSACLES